MANVTEQSNPLSEFDAFLDRIYEASADELPAIKNQLDTMQDGSAHKAMAMSAYKTRRFESVDSK